MVLLSDVENLVSLFGLGRGKNGLSHAATFTPFAPLNMKSTLIATTIDVCNMPWVRRLLTCSSDVILISCRAFSMPSFVPLIVILSLFSLTYQDQTSHKMCARNDFSTKIAIMSNNEIWNGRKSYIQDSINHCKCFFFFLGGGGGGGIKTFSKKKLTS